MKFINIHRIYGKKIYKEIGRKVDDVMNIVQRIAKTVGKLQEINL